MEKTQNKPAQGKEKKLSYDELKRIASELNQQNRQLIERMQQMEKALESRDFDYSSFMLSSLFKVIEKHEVYDKNFVDFCIGNVKDAILSFMDVMKSRDEHEAEHAKGADKEEEHEA